MAPGMSGGLAVELIGVAGVEYSLQYENAGYSRLIENTGE
jgi:hypothetical protein